MEPTTKGTGSKWIAGIAIVLIVLGIIMLVSRNKTEAPVEDTSTVSGENMNNSELEAEIEASMNFETETSMSEMDTVFE